jgi:hypothetical protein
MRLLVRRLPAVVIALATVILVTGCVKLDVDLEVTKDDKVSGTYVVAIDRALLRLTGQDADQLYEQLKGQLDSSSVPEGATVKSEKYDQGDFVGATITIDNLPIDELNQVSGGTDQTNSSDFSLTHEGDEFVFNATIDTSQTSQSDVSIPDQVKSNAEIRVKMTFPGEIVETNGTKDDTSVTWQPKLGETAQLSARAKDSGGASGGGSSHTWLIVVAVIAGLAVVLAVLVALIARGQREKAPPAPPGPSHPPGPPPSLSTLAPPSGASPGPAAPPPAPSGGQPLPPPPPPR